MAEAALAAAAWPAARGLSEAFGGGSCNASCTTHLGLPEFASCAAACVTPPSLASKMPSLFASLVLLMLSGLFSGLTLGLLSLTIEGLDIVISGGTAEERGWAQRILPLRRRGNLLLCTLLLGNTLVNALIAILAASLTSGLVGGLISTAFIVIFGEIIPQSVCSRHGLRIGAAATVIVRPLMLLLMPITLPIAYVLDRLLGREMGTVYTRQQLDKLLEMETANQAISTDDQALLSSALRFSTKVASEIMTPIKDVFMARGRRARAPPAPPRRPAPPRPPRPAPPPHRPTPPPARPTARPTGRPPPPRAAADLRNGQPRLRPAEGDLHVGVHADPGLPQLAGLHRRHRLHQGPHPRRPER
jgi:hypothetical protein